jgi:hypothetical protein
MLEIDRTRCSDGSLKIPAEHAQIPLLFGASKRELIGIDEPEFSLRLT